MQKYKTMVQFPVASFQYLVVVFSFSFLNVNARATRFRRGNAQYIK